MLEISRMLATTAHILFLQKRPIISIKIKSYQILKQVETELWQICTQNKN
jgi:hypothetical protein